MTNFGLPLGLIADPHQSQPLFMVQCALYQSYFLLALSVISLMVLETPMSKCLAGPHSSLNSSIQPTQDADSEDKQGKKSEGAYYIWTEPEIEDAIGPERARIFKPHYFVKPGGNAVLSSRSDPHHEFGGLNTLIERQSVADTARQFGARVRIQRSMINTQSKLLCQAVAFLGSECPLHMPGSASSRVLRKALDRGGVRTASRALVSDGRGRGTAWRVYPWLCPASRRGAGMDTDEVQAVLAKSRKLLHDRRTQRPRPHLDDKVCMYCTAALEALDMVTDAQADGAMC